MHRLLIASLLLLPVAAAAQSHNSSSNCSDGVCTRHESYRPEGAPPWATQHRFERWEEGRLRRPRGGWEDRHGWRPPHSVWAWEQRRPRRARDDDDDDDD